ncbi:MAG TPA: hypothetical protein PLX89_14730, partial [Verrucomicrobiota bacterium]|nr:hypothetical protein [Verrucomicrobiota bacterium]
MVVGILDKPPGPQQFVVLQRLPAFLDRIEGRVEHDAVSVQVGVKCAGCVVAEQAGGKIAGGPMGAGSTPTNPSRSERLKLTQRR